MTNLILHPPPPIIPPPPQRRVQILNLMSKTKYGKNSATKVMGKIAQELGVLKFSRQVCSATKFFPCLYVPSHKQGDVCPNGFPALVERGNNENDSDSE